MFYFVENILFCLQGLKKQIKWLIKRKKILSPFPIIACKVTAKK